MISTAGAAHRFQLPDRTARILVLASCLLPGPSVVIYLVRWFLLPHSDEPLTLAGG